jgi:ketosteroid isomerase-like protein
VFAPDARVVPVGARPRQGLDDIRNFYAKALAPYEHHHDEPTRVLVDGDVVTVEIAFEGTLRDGRRITFDAVDVIDLSDGRIVRLTNWYDVAAVRAQLG